MEFVSTITKDGIRLKGFLYPAKQDTCCLFIPGFAGNPIDNDFIDILCSTLAQDGYTSLCALNRGSFQLYMSTLPGGTEKPKKIGSSVENISDSFFDLDAWYSTVVQMGFKNINMIGHCIGCNKIIHYLAQQKDLSKIANVVLISPLNMRAWLTEKPYFQDIEKAKNREQDKKAGLVRCGFTYKTPSSIDDMLKNPIYMNLPNMPDSNPSDYSNYTKIKAPMTIVFGGEEQVSQTIQQSLINNSGSPALANYFIIPGADHCYEGRERELAATIVHNLNDRKRSKLLLDKRIQASIQRT